MNTHMKLLLFVILTFSAKNLSSQNPNWSDHIAPILYKNCTSCHHLGGLAPNPLMTYGEAFNSRYLMKAYIESGYMPPWPPDPGYKHLAFERVISVADRNKITQWV